MRLKNASPLARSVSAVLIVTAEVGLKIADGCLINADGAYFPYGETADAQI